jgi:hypothetical protein
MGLTDLSFAVTARKDGPSATNLSRAKVFYLKSSDLLQLNADADAGAAVIKVRSNKKKVELYESPDEFLAAQALSQGATNSIAFTKHYQNLAPTSSATAADRTVASKYYNEISTINGGSVKLPDPMSRRLVVIVNGLTGPINVYPNGPTSSATATQQNRIDGATAVYVLAAGARKHFVAPTATTAGSISLWKTAVDA